MKVFYLYSEKVELEKFETLSSMISRKTNNDTIKDAIQELLESLSDLLGIKQLAGTNKSYFSARTSWKMAYRIATNILQRERDSTELTYRFELTHYLFHYLLHEPKFKKSFFLMHGLPLAIDPESDAFKKTVSGSHYRIFREDPGLLFTYVVRGDMVGMDLRSVLMLNNSNIDFTDKTRIIFELLDE